MPKVRILRGGIRVNGKRHSAKKNPEVDVPENLANRLCYGTNPRAELVEKPQPLQQPKAAKKKATRKKATRKKAAKK